MNLTSMVLTWGMVVGYAVFNATGALLIKYKLSKMGPLSFDSWAATVNYFIKVFTSAEVVGGLLLIFSSALVWIGALSRMDLSLAYPAGVGLNFLFVLICAFTYFGEPLTASKMVASALIIISLYLLYRS